MTDELPRTDRTRVRRLHERGRYDRATIDAILDTHPLAHLGTVQDGHPHVTPTFQWREGDRVYWHGSSASRALRASIDQPVCLTVSLLDGLVLARSGFHHSANYRSVSIFGRAQATTDPDEKLARLERFVEGLYPGRWAALRETTSQELKATAVLSLPIEEASAKLRTGPPADAEADLALPVWAGVIPVRLGTGEPEPDAHTPPGTALPEHVRSFRFEG